MDAPPGGKRGRAVGFLLTGVVVALLAAAVLFGIGHAATVEPKRASARDASASCGWRSVALPAVRDGMLAAVASSGPSDVWAVGSVDWEKPLVMHWDGRSWRRIAIAGGGQLRAVTAFAPDDAWAVGISGNMLGLVVHWDGQRWSRVPTKPQQVSLWDVGGSGPQDVWAVGDRFDNNSDRNVALHWNGVNWKSVPTPSFADVSESSGGYVIIGSASLGGVAARAPDDAWAVGELNGYKAAFIQHWDGKRWRLVRTPSGIRDGLGRIEIISRNNVWAVSGPNGGALVLRWNGRAWSKPVQPQGYDASAVAAAPNGVWIAEPLQRWNGRRWVPSSAPSGDYELNGLTAISTTDAWAVGFRIFHPTWPLVLRYRCSE